MAAYQNVPPARSASSLSAPGGVNPLYSNGGLGDAKPLDANVLSNEAMLAGEGPWTWSILPEGLLYSPELANLREPRLGSQLVHERTHGWYWDASVGARVGLLRYGDDCDALWPKPQGWQLEIEGGAFPRLDLEHNEDITSVDFRGGLLATTRQGPMEVKFGFYHISSHIGDEYTIRNPTFQRLNYVREALVLGMAVYLNPSLRLYYDAGWSFQEDGGAQPWEFQVGADFCSPEPTGPGGAPFFAVNGHLRQENNFGGNVSVQTGWQWRGRNGHLLRVGMQYFNGMSEQCQFYNVFEEQIGGGLWYDF